MTFERSTAYSEIHELLTNPRVVRRITATGVLPEPFAVGALAGIEYVVARDRGGLIAAVFVLGSELNQQARGEVHFCFSPAKWGVSEAIAREFLAWFWASYPNRIRLIGPVPSYNQLALRLAKAVGFIEKHVIKNAGEKRGKAYDLLMLEIRRPLEIRKP